MEYKTLVINVKLCAIFMMIIAFCFASSFNRNTNSFSQNNSGYIKREAEPFDSYSRYKTVESEEILKREQGYKRRMEKTKNREDAIKAGNEQRRLMNLEKAKDNYIKRKSEEKKA